MELFPKTIYTPDTSYIQILSAIYFVIAYSPFINFLVVNLVTEKEKKIKEGMRMMGLRDSAFWWVYLLALSTFDVQRKLFRKTQMREFCSGDDAHGGGAKEA